MNYGLPLIPLLPGAAALLIFVLGRRLGLKGAAGIAVASSALSLFFACSLAFQGFLSGEAGLWTNKAEVWAAGPAGEFLHFGEDWKASLAFRMDRLSALMSLLVTFAGTLILIFSIDYMREDSEPVRFFASVSLFISSMLILVLSENLILLFIGWEGVGLCSYLLIGHYWREEGVPLAAYRAFFVNRAGDLFFLLGVFFLLKAFGTVSFAELAEKSASIAALDAGAKLDLTLAAVFLLGGAFGKSAQVPLHVWLPDAMAGPTPVSALIHAATMVTAGVFLLARLEWLYAAVPLARSIVLFAGLLTLAVGAILACFQDDIKKVLAYSTLSHLGLMFIAVAAGNAAAGVFHLFGHASFKALSFLAAGSIILAAHHEQSLTKLRGILRKLPVTRAALWTGAVGGAGLLPFAAAGFYSRESVLHSLPAAEGLPIPGSVIYWIVFCVELIGVVYLFRMMALLETGGHDEGHDADHPVSESGIWAKGVLLLLIVCAVVFGIVSSPVFSFAKLFFVEKALPHYDLASILTASGASVAAAVAAFLAFRTAGPESAVRRIAAKGPVAKLFYFDTIYNALLLRPLQIIADLTDRLLEGPVAAGLLRGTAQASRSFSRTLSGLQSGLVNQYAMIMILSAAMLILLSLLV